MKTEKKNILDCETPQMPCMALRPREAAAAIGVSERTLFTWTKNGDVPHIRIGKTVRYPVDEIRRWMAEKATKSTLKEGGEHEPR